MPNNTGKSKKQKAWNRVSSKIANRTLHRALGSSKKIEKARRPQPSNVVLDDGGEDRVFNKKNVIRLFESEHNKNVKWSSSNECVMFKGIDGKWCRMRGFVELIRGAFYPGYDYARANIRTTGTAPGCVPPEAFGKSEFDFTLVRKIPKSRHAGRDIGARVDAEFTDVVNRKGEVGDESKLEPYTRSMIEARKVWKWTSLMCQFPIAIPEARCGTKIDEIAIDDQQRLIVVENKCGFATYLDLSCRNMNGPLSDVSDAPINQHYLQAGLAAIVLEKRWGVAVQKVYVTQITQTGVVPHAAPQWFWERKEAIYAHFVAYCSSGAVK
jgi:hypothetical protein